MSNYNGGSGWSGGGDPEAGGRRNGDSCGRRPPWLEELSRFGRVTQESGDCLGETLLFPTAEWGVQVEGLPVRYVSARVLQMLLLTLAEANGRIDASLSPEEVWGEALQSYLRTKLCAPQPMSSVLEDDDVLVVVPPEADYTVMVHRADVFRRPSASNN